MIQHTVCFILVHPSGSDAETDFLTTAEAVLPNVPGVAVFRIARQVSSQSDFQWQFSMDFPDQATYDAYDAHPDHRGFVDSRWATEVAAFQEFDFVPVGSGE